MNLNLRLRIVRKYHHLSLKSVASTLNISVFRYFLYETGIVDFPAVHLIKLALFYHTSTDYLLGLTDDPIPHK